MVATRSSLTKYTGSTKRRGRSLDFKAPLQKSRCFGKSLNGNLKCSTATNSTKTILTRSKVDRHTTSMPSISTRSNVNRCKTHVTSILTKRKVDSRKITLKRTSKENHVKMKKNDEQSKSKDAIKQSINRYNRRTIALRRKLLTRSHQNKLSKSKNVVSSFGSKLQNHTVNSANSAEANDATLTEQVEERTGELEANMEGSIGTITYENLLNLRSRGNPIVQKSIREIDHAETVHVSEVFQSVTRSWKVNVTPQLIQSYKVLTCNEQMIQKEYESQLSYLSITTKPIANLYEKSYTRLKDELWDDLRTNRLRPRDKKVNYNVLNGSKKSQNVRLKTPLEIKIASIESTDEPMDIEFFGCNAENEKLHHKLMSVENNESDCHCGTCDNCIADDAETDGCEMSDFENNTENDLNRINETEESSQNYKISHENETGKHEIKKESPPIRRNRKKTEAPTHVSIERFSSSGSDCSDIEIDYPPSPSALDVVKKKLPCDEKMLVDACASGEPGNEHNSQMGSNAPHTIVDEIKNRGNTNALVEVGTLGDRYRSVQCSHEGMKSQSSSEICVSEVNCASDLKVALQKCIERIIKDETKLTIKEDPITAELSEIDYEHFYHLVLVLQGTDFIVKSAAMQNVKGPNDKIRQLYNCVICLKDDTDKVLKEASTGAVEKKHDIFYAGNGHDNSDMKKSSGPSFGSDSCSGSNVNFRRFRTKIAPKSHPYIVPGKARLVTGNCNKMKHTSLNQKTKPKLKEALPKSTELSISPVSMNKPSSNQTTKENTETKGGCGRVVVKATCVKFKLKDKRTDSGNETNENLQLDPDLKDRIISCNSSKMLPDSKALREALRRMGRRKTDPDIHPICRRLNRKPNRKFQLGIEIKPAVKRQQCENVHVSETKVEMTSKSCVDQVYNVVPAAASSVAQTKVVNSKGGSFVNRSELRNFGSPLKVELDNRGRFVDPYKPLERHQETPATALTASELLKLQKIDNSKAMTHTEFSGDPVTRIAEDSDFELGDVEEINRILKVARGIPKGAMKENRPDRKIKIVQLVPTGYVPLQRMQPNSKDDSVPLSPDLTTKPLFKKVGFRKILPRPNSECITEDVNSKALFQDKSSKPSRLQAVSVVTVSNIDSQSIGNIQRCSVTEQNSQPLISPVKRHKRDMSFLKSLLRNKAPMATQNISIPGTTDQKELSPPNFEHSSSEFSHVKRPGYHFQRVENRMELNDGNASVSSLRVPPASFYTSIPLNNQNSSNVVPLKPITVCLTRRTDEGPYTDESRRTLSNQK